MDEVLKYLKLMQGILGVGATIGQAVTWLEVEENAKRLRREGHENDPAGAEAGGSIAEQ